MAPPKSVDSFYIQNDRDTHKNSANSLVLYAFYSSACTEPGFGNRSLPNFSPHSMPTAPANSGTAWEQILPAWITRRPTNSADRTSNLSEACSHKPQSTQPFYPNTCAH